MKLIAQWKEVFRGEDCMGQETDTRVSTYEGIIVGYVAGSTGARAIIRMRDGRLEEKSIKVITTDIVSERN